MRVQLTGLLTGFLLSACAPADEESARSPATVDAVEREAVVPVPAPTADTAAVEALVYVPVYSHIYYRDERRVINLAATLSIRNTDPEHPIMIATVRYYDSAGRLVRGYLREPVLLAPLASLDFVVAEDDTSGGSGANFLVGWGADGNVTEPVIEAVMISTSSTQGISFTSPGRRLERR